MFFFCANFLWSVGKGKMTFSPLAFFKVLTDVMARKEVCSRTNYFCLENDGYLFKKHLCAVRD